jgi:hypothetical protein
MNMMTFIELRDSLVLGGVPSDLASSIAAQQMAKLQTELAGIQAAEQAKAKAKADADAGIVDWQGLRLSNFRNRPSSYCTCHSSGIVAEEAAIGKGASGETAYFPPKVWIARNGHKLVSITQNDAAALLAAIAKLGVDAVVSVLESVGSSEAIEEYQTKRKALVDSKTIAGRGK